MSSNNIKNDLLGSLKSTVKQNPDNTSGNINPTKTDILGNLVGSSIDRTGVQQKDLSKYTDYITNPVISPNVDLDMMRANNQSNWEQARRAVGGGVLAGLATAVEGVSYLFDPTTWGNMFFQQVDYDRNWLADLAVATKQNIYEALPIYRENPNEVFDFGDFAWLMDTTRSLIDSAVGFGIPGLGVAKGVGMASKAFRALSYADKANDVLNVLRQTEKTSKIMQSLSAGYLTNHMETMVMATEMYDGLLNSPDIKAILDKGGEDAIKAKNTIAQKVHNFALINKVFALTNALQIGSVIKTRGQLSKSGVKSFLKDLAKDAPIEAFEEAGQGVSQKFFEDMTRRDLGLAENYDSSSLFNKAMDIFMQEETALEAMMGVFGGPVQYAITKAPLEIANMKEANKWKEKQQQVLEKNKEYVEKIGKRTKQYETLQKLAKDLNNQELAKQISDLEFENIAIDNFEVGIADQLERSLQDVVDNKQQEYTAEEVKIAEEKISKLKELEKQWNNATKYENPGEIFRLETLKRHYEQQLDVASPLVDDIYKDALNRYNQKLTVLDSDRIIRNRALNISIDNQELTLNEPVGVTTDTSQKGIDNLVTPTFESIRENVLGELSGRKDIKDFNKAKKILEKTNKELAEKKSYKHQRKLFKAKQQEKKNNQILEKAGKTESLDELNRLKDETTNPEVKAEIEHTIQNKQLDKKEAITGKKEAQDKQETPVTPEQSIQQNEEGEVTSNIQKDDFNIPSQTTQQTPQTPNENIKAKKADIERRRQEELSNIQPVYHHTQVKIEDFNFSSFKRGYHSISQFGDGLNASSNTTSFLVNRYGKPIQGEVSDKDFIEIDANKSEKEIYEYLKAKGYKFSRPSSYYDGTEKAKNQPAIIELFQDFQNNNPDIKGVKVIGHVIGGQEVSPFYVIYDSKSFYGQDSLKNKINAERDAEYIDAVKKGEMTKEQAMQALEQAGRKDSKAYAELKALEEPQPRKSIEAKKADIEKRRKEELNKGRLAFDKATNKEELTKAVKDWVNKDPYDTGFVFLNVRAALTSPGGFEKGKEMLYENHIKPLEKYVNDKINAKYDAELAALEQQEPITELKGTTISNTQEDDSKSQRIKASPNKIVFTDTDGNNQLITDEDGYSNLLLSTDIYWEGREIELRVDKAWENYGTYKNNVNKVPIAVFDKATGAKLGGVQLPEYVKDDLQREKLNKVRQAVFDTGKVETKIKEYTIGRYIEKDRQGNPVQLYTAQDEKAALIEYYDISTGEVKQAYLEPLSTAIGDDVLIGYKNTKSSPTGLMVRTADGKTQVFSEASLDEESRKRFKGPGDGQHWLFFKVGVNKDGEPIYKLFEARNNRLSEEIADTIILALEAYQTQNEQLLKQFSDMGYDVSDVNGIENFISLFTVVRPDDKTDGTTAGMVVRGANNIQIAFATDKHSPTDNGGKQYQYIASPNFDGNLGESWKKAAKERLLQTYFTMNTPNYRGTVPVLNKETGQLENANIEGNNYMDWVKQNFYMTHKPYKAKIQQTDGTSTTVTRLWQHPQFSYDIDNIQLTTKQEEQSALPIDDVLNEDKPQPIKVKTNSGNITIQPDGKMFYDNGNEVTEETVKNKALVKKANQEGTLIRVEYNNSQYGVLPDNRIISLNESSAGKEVFKAGPQRIGFIKKTGLEIGDVIKNKQQINEQKDNKERGQEVSENLNDFIDNELGLGGSIEDFNLPNEQYALNLDDDRLTELLNQGVFKSAFERINYLTLVSDVRKEIVAQLVEKGDKVNIEAIAQGYIKKLESTRDKILAKLEQADPSTPGYDRLEAFGKVFNTTLALDRKVLMDGVTNELRAIQQVKIALDEDSGISETSDNFTEQQGFEGTRSLTENHKSKISGKLKLFLSNIKDVTKDTQGNLVPKKSRFGQEERIPFDTAYDTLHTILVNTEPRLSTMMNKLSELKDIKGLEWLNEVIAKIQNADTDVQNGFVTDMAKHKVSMYFVRWERQTVRNKDGKVNRSKSGKYKLKMVNDNSSDDAIVLRKNWKIDLQLNSGLFTPTGQDVQINYGRIDEIKALGQKAIDEANNIVNNNHIPAMLALGDYLASIGIAINEVGEISDGLRELYFNGIKTKEKKAQIVSTIVNKVNTDVLGPLNKDYNSDTYDPFRSNIFSGIANIQAQYQNRLFATNFRVGDKNIQAFSNPKFLSLRLNQLNGEYISNENGELIYVPSETAKGLQKVVGARKNYMVEELADPNSQLFSLSKREGLELAYTSVAPFKKARKAIGKDKSLRQLSDGEHEVIKLAFFTANTSKIKSVYTQGTEFNRRRIAFYFPTNSDKETTNPVYYYAFVPTYKMDEVGYIDNEFTQLLFNNLVAPEIDRIKIMGNGDKLNLNTYKSDLFYYLPELNSHVFTTQDGKSIRYAQAIMRKDIDETQFEEEVKQIIRQRVQSEVDNKLKFWAENNIGLTNNELGKDSFIDGDYLSTVNNDQRKLAVDMVTNYMLFTSAMHATVIGDPAEYYKPSAFKEGKFYKFIESKKYTREEYDALDTATKLMLEGEFAVGAVEESTVNLGKRLAADIAPGNQLTMDSGYDDNYIQLFFNDQKDDVDPKTGEPIKRTASASTEYINTLKYLFPNHPEIWGEYGEIDATDAQEYTTVKEHLTFLVKLGKLSQKTADDLYKKIYDTNTTKLSVADIKNIFQPVKPVFVDNLEEANPYDVGNLTYNRRLYIKTSSFPLIPQLTAGKSIDNLRVAMEELSSNSKNLGVRAVFKSGTKVGFPKTGLEVLENDGLTFKSSADITKAINSNPQAYSTLSRSGLRNQQENPSKDKYVVNDGTQQRKLLFNNILDKIIDKKTGKKGIDYLREYEQAYDDLFKLKRDEFRNEVLNENGELNIEKLAQVLRDEAVIREYSKQDIDFLEVEFNAETGKPEFIIPLELNPSSKKFQSLLNAIVNNRILKLKPPGYSFYLASEAGFGKNPIKQTDNVQQVISEYQDDIIYFTKNGKPTWDGKSLEGMRYSDNTHSKVLPAQILVQPKIKLPNGKTLMDYATKTEDGTYTIEVGKDGKFDEELLQIFGYRIPTQGHNSMSYIEIVGFLPETSGDLVVAPMHFTKQMGSDFDIDKLFTHMYASYSNDVEIRRIKDNTSFTQAFNEQIRARKLLKDKVEQLEMIDSIGQAIFNELDDTKPFSEITLDKLDYVKIAMQELGITKEDLQIPFNLKEAQLFNKIMDIHRDIMLSPTKEVQQQIHYTLGFDNLKFNGKNVYKNEDTAFQNEVNNNGGIAQAIANKESKERNNQGKLPPSILSDSYQREKYTNANAATVAIGAFAIDNTFHALAQKLAITNNQLQLTQEGVLVDLSFGTLTNNSLQSGKLGGSKAFNQDGTVSDKYISDIISAFLSSAVDNEKEQILNKININSETLGVVKAMSMAGYPSDIIALILTQPIIKEYVTEIQKVKSSLAAYDPNAEDELIAKLELKYGKTEDNSGLIANSLTQESNLSSRLYDMVGKDITQPKDKYAQLYTLERFLALKKAGDQIQNVQSIINTDSKFLGKSIVHNNLKANKIVNGLVEIRKDEEGNNYVANASGILNSEKLVGSYIPSYEVSNPQELLDKGYIKAGGFYIKPSSISGFASIYGTLEASQIYRPLFPVLNSRVVLDIFNSYIKTPDTRLEQEEQNMLDYFEEVKSHIYAQKEFFGEDGSTARLRLLNEDTGVGAIINQLKKSEDPRIKRYIDNNEFLKRLEPSVINEKFKEVGVEFNGATALLAHDEHINFDFLNMLQDDRTILIGNVTPKQLAKDLILYSFATGGIQKAKQFVRYVPTEVLKSTPALAYLKELSTSPKLRDVMETRNFITQYYQNNPRQAVALKPDNYVKLNETGSVLRIKMNEDNQPVVVTHEYIYEDLGYNQTRLYIWDDNNDVYHELETKNQSTDIKQYGRDYKSPNVFTKQVSIQSEPPLVPHTADTFVMGDDGKPIQVKPDSTNYHKELIKRSGSKQTLQTVLDGISANSENQFTRELAKVFNKNLGKLPNIEFKHTNTFKNTVDNITINLANKAAFGAHVYDRNTNTITIAISPNLKNESTAKYEEIVMHEISHAFTVAGLQKKSKLKAFAGINRSYLRFMQELNDNRSKLSDKELKQLDYAASTLEEFTAMAMSNHTVQTFMNGYNAQETTNLVQSILKLLKEFLGLTEGTEAYALLSNIINLIETSDSQDLGFESNKNNVITQYYEGDITPEPNTVFVFGSNPEGRHGGGNAKIAKQKFGIKNKEFKSNNAFGLFTKDLMGYANFDKFILKTTPFGAVYYESEGATFWKDKIDYKGKRYNKLDDGTATTGFIKEGLIKKGSQFERASEGGKWLHKLPADFIQVKIAELYEEAKNNPTKQYKIAYNTDVKRRSLNGYTGLEMIDMFNNAGSIPSNIIFSKQWVDTGKLNLGFEDGTNQSEDASEIYSKLGNKTKSENVIIKSWGELKDAQKAITPEGIISTRIKMASVHFGNPFTSDKRLQNLIQTESTKESVERYINWILTGETGEYVFTGLQPGELEFQREWILEQLKSGNLKNKPILYYKELGEPSHATALDYLINKYDWNKELGFENNTIANDLFTISSSELSKVGGESFSDMQQRVKQNINIRNRIKIADEYNIEQGKLYKFSELKDIFNNSIFNNSIYNDLQGILPKINFRFGSLNTINKKINGYYDSNNNTISLEILHLKNPDFKRTLLHEIIHAATFINTGENITLTSTQKIALNNLNNLIEELKKDNNFLGEYGLTNVNELLAELSNEKFVNKLKGKTFDSNQSFFEKIISEIVKLLGLKTTAYDIVKESFDNLSKEKMTIFESNTGETTTQYAPKLNSLGMSIAEFLRTLPKESRDKMRELLRNDLIKTKCK